VFVVVLVAIAFALGGLRNRETRPAGDEHAGHTHGDRAVAPTLWTCSMHPQIKLPEEGKCPICAMDLIPLETAASADLGPRQLRMSEAARSLARIQTTPAIRAFAESDIRMYGRAAYDESRLAYITARVPGRLDRLYADYTGVAVKKGDHIVDMYSPELLAAQEELLQAKRAVSKLGSSSSEVLRSTAQSTLIASREKLRLYGLTSAQIDEVENTGKASEQLTIYAPAGGVVVHKNAREGMYVTTGTRIYTIADLSTLWVLFEAYESDVPWIHYGQRVDFTAQSFPGETFEAVISFIDPLVDPETRTIRVRAVVDNNDGRLKPDMFLTGQLKSRIDADGHIIDIELANKWICPMHPEIVRNVSQACEECGMDLVPASKLGFVPAQGNSEDAPILIPVTAPLVTGKRAVVYVEIAGTQGIVYEGREIELGPRAGDFYVVNSGILEGELVVTNGAFKIDSELQIQAKPSMMSPDGGATPTTHNHGDESSSEQKSNDHSSSATQEPGSVHVSTAALDALAPVYVRYFALQMGLANDNFESAKSSAKKLGEASAGVDVTLFSEESRQRWTTLSKVVEQEAKRITLSSDIAAARDVFFALSAAIIELETSLGHGGNESFFLAYCPMARDYKGAHWLQQVDVVWNSYWGAQMLRCGSIKQEFAAATTEGESPHDAH